MRVFTCTNFSGHNPVGTSAVIVAKNRREAKRVLAQSIQEYAESKGMTSPPQDESDWYFNEVNIHSRSPYAEILQDGDY